MNYFLKLDTIEILNDKRVLVTVGTNSFVVDESMVEKAPDITTGPQIWSKLDDINRTTLSIKRLLANSEQPKITIEPVPEPAPEPAPEPEPEPAPEPEPEHDLEALGLKSSSDAPPPPFKVNDDVTKSMSISEVGKQLAELYEKDPRQRRRIISKIAGMVRLDMLAIKEDLSSDIRNAVVSQLMQRDSLNTPIIPPDLAAFLDDRPLHETLGSRQWDPGNDRATDTVGPNWSESERVLDKISQEVDHSEFDHLYPTTEFAAVEVNRKFSSSNTLKK